MQPEQDDDGGDDGDGWGDCSGPTRGEIGMTLAVLESDDEVGRRSPVAVAGRRS
jgi:hypothetical protein